MWNIVRLVLLVVCLLLGLDIHYWHIWIYFWALGKRTFFCRLFTPFCAIFSPFFYFEKMERNKWTKFRQIGQFSIKKEAGENPPACPKVNLCYLVLNIWNFTIGSLNDLKIMKFDAHFRIIISFFVFCFLFFLMQKLEEPTNCGAENLLKSFVNIGAMLKYEKRLNDVKKVISLFNNLILKNYIKQN